MQGSIRFFLGLLLVFGAVGGMDNPEQSDYLLAQTITAMIGLALMYWATKYLTEAQ